MIDSGRKTWTVYTWRTPDGNIDSWTVVATRWTVDGPENETLIGKYPTEDAARSTAVAAQQEYDRLRQVMFDSTVEGNRSE